MLVPGSVPKISKISVNPPNWPLMVSIVWAVVSMGCRPISPARFTIWFNDAPPEPVRSPPEPMGSPPDSTVEITSPVIGSTRSGIGGRGRSKMLGKPPINSGPSSSVLATEGSIWVPITSPEEFKFMP